MIHPSSCPLALAQARPLSLAAPNRIDSSALAGFAAGRPGRPATGSYGKKRPNTPPWRRLCQLYRLNRLHCCRRRHHHQRGPQWGRWIFRVKKFVALANAAGAGIVASAELLCGATLEPKRPPVSQELPQLGAMRTILLAPLAWKRMMNSNDWWNVIQ